MADIRTIRRRIRSVENTAKITGAMEMIAASKLRRAQQRVFSGRPYSEKMLQVLANLAGLAGQSEEIESLHPLLEKRDVANVLLLLVTPDRGLTGGLNANLNRRAARFVLEEKAPTRVVTIGKKGRDFMVRHGQDVQATFMNMGDQFTVADILPVSHIITNDYTSGQVDRVYLIYAKFKSMLVQEPVLKQLLPIEAPAATEPTSQVDYIYEPDSKAVLAQLLPRYVVMQLYQSMLEANASEHSARMVAMRNATDAASDMVQTLTLDLNKARQASITADLLDITGGVAALEG